MTISSYPYSALQESQWNNITSCFLNIGVVPNQLSLLQVYGDSSGMQVKVHDGWAWWNGVLYTIDAASDPQILAITASNATYGRIDSVVVDFNLTTQATQLLVVTGTAGPSPVAPTLTQTSNHYQLLLANITVAANVVTIAAGNVTDQRSYANPVLASNGRILTLLDNNTENITDTTPTTSYKSYIIAGNYGVPANAVGVKLFVYIKTSSTPPVGLFVNSILSGAPSGDAVIYSTISSLTIPSVVIVDVPLNGGKIGIAVTNATGTTIGAVVKGYYL